jgi:hypothetical protein
MNIVVRNVGGEVAWPPFEPRRVAFLDLWQDVDWAVKAYAIVGAGQDYDHSSICTAQHAFNSSLAWIVRTDAGDPQPNVGFALCDFGVLDGLHSTARMRFCWWTSNGTALSIEMLQWRSTGKSPHASLVRRNDVLASVDELRVIAFERDAWERLVLRRSNRSPDLDSYLDARLSDEP